MWIGEQRRVRRLAIEAAADRRSLARTGRRLRQTTMARLATPESAVWSFAAGALWGSASKAKNLSRFHHALTSLLEARLAWRLLTRIDRP